MSAWFDLDLLLKGGITLLTRFSKRLAKYSGGGQAEEFGETKYLAKDSEKGVCKKLIVSRHQVKGFQLKKVNRFTLVLTPSKLRILPISLIGRWP